MNVPSPDYGYPSQGGDEVVWTSEAFSELFDAEPDAGDVSAGDPGYGYPTPASSQDWEAPVWGRPIWGPIQPSADWPPVADPETWDYEGYPEPDEDRRGYPLAEYAQWAKVATRTETPPATPPVRRSSRGTVALALALAALGISLMLSAWGGQAFAAADELSGGNFDPNNPTAAAAGMASRFLMSVFAQLAPSVLGLIALILGITGLRTSSRGAAIGAIIIAVLAPLLSFMVFAVISASGTV